MATYIVAVSGGVDSVALLHMLYVLGAHRLIVAHVDHGIRPESADDAAFVRQLSAAYDLPFELSTHQLGPNASEEQARLVRYAFLRQLADKYDAKILTAHHMDDVVETVAINVHRGTGWRGLATHDSDVIRPLIGLSKAQLHNYVRRHRLEWQEDSTNRSHRYLRNRLRTLLHQAPAETSRAILDLREKQLRLKQAIQQEVRALIGDGPIYSRYFFTHISPEVAVECLREITKGRLTRPQLRKLLLAIKTTAAGKTVQLGAGATIRLTTRNFSLSLIK